MKLLSSKEVKTEANQKVREQEDRVRKLKEAEVQATKDLNDALDKKIENKKKDELALAKNEGKAKVQK